MLSTTGVIESTPYSAVGGVARQKLVATELLQARRKVAHSSHRGVALGNLIVAVKGLHGLKQESWLAEFLKKNIAAFLATTFVSNTVMVDDESFR